MERYEIKDFLLLNLLKNDKDKNTIELMLIFLDKPFPQFQVIGFAELAADGVQPVVGYFRHAAIVYRLLGKRQIKAAVMRTEG